MALRTAEPRVRRVQVPLVELAAATALLIGAVVLVLALSAGARSDLAAEGAGTLPPGDLSTFLAIAGRNTASALGLFSGAVTFGLGTVVFLLLIGTMLGWSIGTSLDVLGAAETLARSWAYTPLELAGLVVAGAAGLIPVVGLLRARPPVPFSRHLARSLRWLAVAVALIVLAAAVETVAIALHH